MQRRSCIPLIVASVLVVTILLYTTHHSLLSQLSKLSFRSNAQQPLTQSATIILDFAEHDEFQSLSAAADKAWDAVLPPNGGYVYKEDENGQRRVHGISMFHQLHCLQMLRGTIQGLMDVINQSGEQRASEAHQNSAHGHHHHNSGGMPDGEHWMHCLDYLRQAVLCAADNTIEPPIRKNGKDIANPMVAHVCKSSQELWDMSVKSGFRNQTKPTGEHSGHVHHHEH